MRLFGRSINSYFEDIDDGSLSEEDLRAFLKKSPDNVNVYNQGQFRSTSLLVYVITSSFISRYLPILLEFKPNFAQPAVQSNDPDDADKNIFYYISNQQRSQIAPTLLKAGADPKLLFENGGEEIYASDFRTICRGCDVPELKNILKAGFESSYFLGYGSKSIERFKSLYFIMLEKMPLTDVLISLENDLDDILKRPQLKDIVITSIFDTDPKLINGTLASLITKQTDFFDKFNPSAKILNTIIEYDLIPIFKNALIRKYKDNPYFDSTLFKLIADHALIADDELKDLSLKKIFHFNDLTLVKTNDLLKDHLKDIALATAFQDIKSDRFKLDAYLLQGFDLNWRKDEKGKSLLIEAAIRGEAELIEAMITSGADINHRLENGKSFLDFLSNPNRARIEVFLKSRDPAVVVMPPIKITDTLKMEEIFLFDRGEVLIRVSEHDGKNPSQSLRSFQEMPEHILAEAFNQHQKRGGTKTPADYDLKTKHPEFKITRVLK